MAIKVNSLEARACNSLYSAFSEGDKRPGAAALTDPKLHWESLIGIAEQERVLPALHARLQELGITSSLPAEITDFLYGVEELNRERNHAIFAETTTVVALLNQAGIEPVLLKGAAYCMTGVYANPAMRYLVDVDLLVGKRELSTSTKILIENGFDWDRNDQLGLFRHHHPPLRRRGAVPFEVHRTLGMGPCAALLPAEEVLERSIRFEIDGIRFRVPCPDHLVTHLIMHSQLHHPYQERIWPPLRAMYDLVLLQRRFENEIDWSNIARNFHGAGQGPTLALHLFQVKGLLGWELPFAIRWNRLTRVRWLRRRLLRRLPTLRFIDPRYVYSTVLTRRLRLLRNTLVVPGGWKFILKELVGAGIYRRFITDAIEGRGR